MAAPQTKSNKRMVQTRVMLWTTARSVSTAFEKSIRTLKNGKVFHEPFFKAFNFGPERHSQQCASQEIDQQATYRSVCEMLQEDYDGKEFVFSKEITFRVGKKFDIFLEEGFKEFKHTFLIRHPLKVISSLFKALKNPKITEFRRFNPAKVGFRQMLELYEFVERHIHKDPIVVDADDLLDFPNETMQSYCEAVGLKYEEHMTSWEPGHISPDWDWQAGWYEDVVKTSGFIPRSQENKAKVLRVEDLPPEMAEVVEECIPYYEALRTKTIRPRKTAQYLATTNDTN